MQGGILEIVFVDIPARHDRVVDVRIEQAQGKYEPGTIVAYIEPLDVTPAAGHGAGNIDNRGVDSGAGAQVDIAAGRKQERIAHIGLHLGTHVVHRNRALDEGDRDFDDAGINALARTARFTGTEQCRHCAAQNDAQPACRRMPGSSSC